MNLTALEGIWQLLKSKLQKQRERFTGMPSCLLQQSCQGDGGAVGLAKGLVPLFQAQAKPWLCCPPCTFAVLPPQPQALHPFPPPPRMGLMKHHRWFTIWPNGLQKPSCIEVQSRMCSV